MGTTGVGTFKDLFSGHAGDYARYRPTYPPALYDWLAAEAPARTAAVDVGTGNGQVAVALARHFERVVGVDPSREQLANATPHERVEYRAAPAEALGLEAASADTITAGQALHWFKLPGFIAEVSRVARPGAVLAVWCYGVPTVTPALDDLIGELYDDILGAYWEPERRLVDSGYAGLAFPFRELEPPPFDMRLRWSLAQLAGLLDTWSPVKKYTKAHGKNPLEDMLPRLERAWGAEATRDVTFPLSVRAFRVG